MTKVFTSEAVTEGHPDKMCDIIADTILDAILEQDSKAKVACEVTVTTNLVNVMGEITTTANINLEELVRKIIIDIGYNQDEYGFNGHTCQINNYVHQQSPDIAMGVDKGGAGDQGIMFGYACSESDELMPLPILLAHKLAYQLTKVRKEKTIPYLRPDGKTQVTVEYEGEEPKRIRAIVISNQHNPNVNNNKLRMDIIDHVIKSIIPNYLLDDETKYYINPTGAFVIGGPHGDTGLTGRKIIIDTYGGYARHGGGAFSGKDATKVDRSAAYMARYIAKNIVGANLAKECEIEIAYAIGVSEPLSIYINTFNTSSFTDEQLINAIKTIFDLTPRGIIKTLELDKPIYKDTACYGHFGKLYLNWEKLDKTKILKKFLYNLPVINKKSKIKIK
jgi:S-adenosylmethionine synthetase